ncbi:MAG TPA: ornithine cyclodeaminase family protein [Candidatus Limnocylindria bacterium]
MRLLRAADIDRACPMADAIAAVEAGFAALSGGRATVPVRASVPLAREGVALSMPAALSGGPHWSVKLVTVAPGNPGRGLPLIAASVLLGDAETGMPLALLDGTRLTALRTGAAGGVAAKALARPESGVVALFGAGAQARTQLAAISSVLEGGLRELRIVARDPSHAARFAAEAARDGVRVVASTAEDAVRGADIVITATSSATPVFPGRALSKGVHVTAVGSFKPTMCELDDDTLRGARIVVDQREAALAEAGELEGLSGADVTEIGEVIARTAPGRRSAGERTVFKSVGNAIQDLVVASRVYERALEMGLGEEIAWP